MENITRSVALVGRPNVGKSRLFNRLAGRRVSIVHDQPGVTRDLVTTQVSADRGGYLLMDTGGLGLPSGAAPAAVALATEEQVDFAIQAAGLVLFVTDAGEGLTTADERVAERLRAFRKPTILVANKADDGRREDYAIAEFSRLGFGDVVAVSAEHGRGMEDLHNRILQILGSEPTPDATVAAIDDRIKFAFVGRPNVGKSSLGNALLHSSRLIVSDVPGTTRDAISIDLDYTAPNGEVWPFTLMDTAGLRHGSRVNTSVEFFSQNRAREAIQGCDIVFLVLDSLEGVTKQDKMLAGDVLRAGVGLVIVVNKWDIARDRFAREPLPGYDNEEAFRKSFLRAVERELFFLPQSPVIFTSALEGLNVTDILMKAREVRGAMRRQLPTSALNRVLRGFLEVNPPKMMLGRRFKCYYALQVARQPFVIRIYCNHAEKLEEGYSRHLAAGVQTAFKLQGCPITFALIGKPPREPRAPMAGKFSRGPAAQHKPARGVVGKPWPGKKGGKFEKFPSKFSGPKRKGPAHQRNLPPRSKKRLPRVAD
jgi:GTP-binding protein